MPITGSVYLRFTVWASMLLLVLSFGCAPGSSRPGSATATAQADQANILATRMAQQLQSTRTAQEVQAAAARMARQERLEDARTWPAVMVDAFEVDANRWAVGEAEDPLADVTRLIDGGRYHWEASAKDGFVWWATPESENQADFYLSVRVRQTSGSLEGEHGVVFRVDREGNSYYVFEINEVGQFGFFLHGQDGWVPLIDWQESAAVLPDEENRLEVVARTDQFLFAVNGQPVAEAEDRTLESGQAGLLIGLSNAGDQGEWEFDDFELLVPAKP